MGASPGLPDVTKEADGNLPSENPCQANCCHARLVALLLELEEVLLALDHLPSILDLQHVNQSSTAKRKKVQAKDLLRALSSQQQAFLQIVCWFRYSARMTTMHQCSYSSLKQLKLSLILTRPGTRRYPQDEGNHRRPRCQQPRAH